MLDTPATKIVYFYTEISDQISRISKIPHVEIVRNFDQDIIDDWTPEAGHLVVVLDDFMLDNSVYAPLAELFAVKSRKKFISCAILTQNLYTRGVPGAGRYNKEIQSNSTVTVLFCNKRDQSVARQFARTAFSGRFQFFMSVYRTTVCAENSKGERAKGRKLATERRGGGGREGGGGGKSSSSRGHRYLAIFSDPNTSQKYELRTKIFFRNELTHLFWSRKWIY